MKIKIIKLCLMMILISCNNLFAQHSKQKICMGDFKICWKIKDVIYEYGGSYSDRDIDSLKGQVICLNKDTINIIGDTVIHAKYSIKKESTFNFIENYFQVYEGHIKKLFKITADSLIVVKLTGTFYKVNPEYGVGKSPTNYEFAYDNRYLYLPDNGAMFRLVKQNIAKPKSK